MSKLAVFLGAALAPFFYVFYVAIARWLGIKINKLIPEGKIKRILTKKY